MLAKSHVLVVGLFPGRPLAGRKLRDIGERSIERLIQRLAEGSIEHSIEHCEEMLGDKQWPLINRTNL